MKLLFQSKNGGSKMDDHIAFKSGEDNILIEISLPDGTIIENDENFEKNLYLMNKYKNCALIGIKGDVVQGCKRFVEATEKPDEALDINYENLDYDVQTGIINGRLKLRNVN